MKAQLLPTMTERDIPLTIININQGFHKLEGNPIPKSKSLSDNLKELPSMISRESFKILSHLHINKKGNNILEVEMIKRLMIFNKKGNSIIEVEVSKMIKSLMMTSPNTPFHIIGTLAISTLMICKEGQSMQNRLAMQPACLNRIKQAYFMIQWLCVSVIQISIEFRKDLIFFKKTFKTN